MERDNQESQRKEVAVKKLTRQASERNGSLYEDFKNELEIMKVNSLNVHNNFYSYEANAVKESSGYKIVKCIIMFYCMKSFDFENKFLFFLGFTICKQAPRQIYILTKCFYISMFFFF